nr:ABC transporter ATP-binding protein [uncultured Lachnoclostridium sp.]
MIEQIKLYKNMFKYSKGNIAWYVLLFICMGLKTATSLLSPWLLSQIVDDSIASKDISRIIILSILSVVLCIISSAVIIVAQGITTKIERKITIEIREQCLNNLLAKTGDFYTSANSSDLLTLFMQDIENVSNMLSSQVISIIFDIITVVGIALFLFYTYFKLSLIVFIILVILVRYQKRINKKMESVTDESRLSIIRLQKLIQELISNSLSFIVGNFWWYQTEKIRKCEQDFAKVKLKTSLTMSCFSSTVSMLSSILSALIIGVGAIRVVNAKMSVGTLLAFNVYSQKLMSPLIDLANISIDLAVARVSYDRIQKLLDNNNQVQANEVYKSKGSCEIVFENVSFSYNNREQILKDISFTIKKGQVHAFAGESGGGKSTIINLIFGLWYSSNGIIKIDGKNLKDYSLTSYRDKVSIVSQNVFLLDDTIYNNITLGDVSPDDEKVRSALKKAKMWDYVKGLEEGWDSNIGENGIRLSGGEKQRIAIARAIYKNSDLLIFDEATSMLDNETEYCILQDACEIFKGKTVIMIAHRLSTIKKADCISILKKGRIVEEGTHEELLQKGNVYYKMYHYQQ